MNSKKTVAGAVIAGALGFSALGLGTGTANADPGPPPIPGISVPDVVPPPGQLGQLPFIPPRASWDSFRSCRHPATGTSRGNGFLGDSPRELVTTRFHSAIGKAAIVVARARSRPASRPSRTLQAASAAKLAYRNVVDTLESQPQGSPSWIRVAGVDQLRPVATQPISGRARSDASWYRQCGSACHGA